MKDVYIINKSGEKELFSEKKIYSSVRRVGASKKLAEEIATKIRQEIYPGMTTYEIYDRVEEMLEKGYPRGGIRFRLKEAMRNLGPSGFPFEKYIGDILEQLGFKVKINQFIKGSCVVHEVDIVAREKKYCLIGECKYHSLPGSKVDLKIGLYHYARYLDIELSDYCKKQFKNLQPRPIVITNNKFSRKLIQYAECVGLDLLGWRFPRGTGLEYIIETEKFYPITILPSFKNDLLEPFAAERIMLAQDLLKIDAVKYAKKMGVSEKKIAALKKEAETLLG
ncbi:MAG: ATP cone domain-containing protein [Candidatus Pacebacteria bacterium]|nr:ATP cone domain-containing protein [Candidatus Paceibacterota bacterium]